MANYLIKICFNAKNKQRYKMLVRIGEQPQVMYNGLDRDDIIKFINGHNEFITVTLQMPKRYYETFIRLISGNNITCYNISLTESIKS